MNCHCHDITFSFVFMCAMLIGGPSSMYVLVRTYAPSTHLYYAWRWGQWEWMLEGSMSFAQESYMVRVAHHVEGESDHWYDWYLLLVMMWINPWMAMLSIPTDGIDIMIQHSLMTSFSFTHRVWNDHVPTVHRSTSLRALQCLSSRHHFIWQWVSRSSTHLRDFHHKISFVEGVRQSRTCNSA